jgi:hypothetical protein
MEYPHNFRDACDKWCRTVQMRAGRNAACIIVATHLRERFPQRSERQSAKADILKYAVNLTPPFISYLGHLFNANQ